MNLAIQGGLKDGIVTVYGKAGEAKNPIPVKEGAPTNKKRPTLNPRITYGVGARHPREQAKKLFYSGVFIEVYLDNPSHPQLPQQAIKHTTLDLRMKMPFHA